MVLLLAGVVAVLPFRGHAMPRYDSFILVMDALVFLCSLFIAVRLCAEHFTEGRVSVLVLACGYFFSALIIIPHALTFPGVFAEQGLLGAGRQTTAWLYLIWHVSLPPTVLAYTLLKGTRFDEPGRLGAPARSVAAAIALAVLVALALTWLVTSGERLLPGLMVDEVRRTRAWTDLAAVPVLAMSLAAIVIVWLCRTSTLDLWLLVVLWAWFIETLLLGLTADRFSAVWYVGRVIGALSSGVLLIPLAIRASAKSSAERG